MKDHDSSENKGKHQEWKFQVDKEKFEVGEPSITGRKILELAGKLKRI